MADFGIVFDKGRVSISLEGQHISRMTEREVRSLICNLLVFGGKELREEIKEWLNGGKIEQVAEVIAPEEKKAEWTGSPYDIMEESRASSSTQGSGK